MEDCAFDATCQEACTVAGSACYVERDACQECIDSCSGDAGCEESCSYGPCSWEEPQGEPMMGGDGADWTDPCAAEWMVCMGDTECGPLMTVLMAVLMMMVT